MKKRISAFFAIVIVLTVFSVNVAGQGATATATATATIVTPISITNTSNMNFGNIAVNATGGTVVLAPGGTRTSTGGVTLPADIGTVSAAVFTVAGIPGAAYSISLPASTTVVSGGNSMTVNTFTSNPSGTGNLDGTTGDQTLQVGATLNVGASQPTGIYESGTFDVTVNYN